MCISVKRLWTGCCYYAFYFLDWLLLLCSFFLPVVAITPFFLLIFGLVVVIKLFFFFFFTGCCYYAFLVRTKRAQCRHSFLFSRASPSFLRRARKYTGCALAFHNDVNEYEKVSFDFFLIIIFPQSISLLRASQIKTTELMNIEQT